VNEAPLVQLIDQGGENESGGFDRTGQNLPGTMLLMLLVGDEAIEA
jgi:hypothetical protein